jgi:hypothetical protein
MHSDAPSRVLVGLTGGGFSALVGHSPGAEQAGEDLHLPHLPRPVARDESQYAAFSRGRPGASASRAYRMRGQTAQGRHVVDQGGVGTDEPTSTTSRPPVVAPTPRQEGAEVAQRRVSDHAGRPRECLIVACAACRTSRRSRRSPHAGGRRDRRGVPSPRSDGEGPSAT